MINRGIALAVTIAFLAFVKPDPNPSLVGVALVAIIMYEAIRHSIEYVTRTRQKHEHRRVVLMNRKAMEEAGHVLDDMIFNPIREVI